MTKHELQLYMHGYILWFPVTVVGAVITHKMFDAGTKRLSVTDDWLKVFLGPCGWRNSIFKSYSLQSLCQPTKMKETLDVFHIYFFGQWFVKIKLKELSLLICEFVSNFVARYWYKMVATPCSRHGLWLCKAILQVSKNIDHLFLTYTKKCDGRNFSYTYIKHWLVAQNLVM